MNAFTLRRATVKDCPLINKLASQVWNPTYASIHTQEQLDYMFEQMYHPDNLTKQLEEGHAFFIGYTDNKPIGYFSIEQKEQDLFYLQKFYILPQSQGTGAGKFLFASALSYIKSIHPLPCTLELTVNRKNKAIAFYEYMRMHKLRESDEPIGNGFVMNCCFMGMTI